MEMTLQLSLFLTVHFSVINCYAKLPETTAKTPVPKLPELEKSTVELIQYWGYPAETHKVITKDGYILNLHRIPHARVGSYSEQSSSGKPKPVFFLQHALICSSSSFLLNLPHQNLAFILADAGYDVWMGNVRGNTYSRHHVSLNASSEAFWDFTFQDMAEYDLPAMIDYTLNHTNQKQVYYVGHSQGTLMAFAGLSENEELQKKIKIVFAMAPVTRIQHPNPFIKTMANFENGLKVICRALNYYELFASTEQLRSFSEKLCPHLLWLCNAFLKFLNGYSKVNVNQTRLHLYLTNIPAGTSVKNLDHYLQNVNTRLFKKYDYGRAGNLKHYGDRHAPKYDLRNVKTPVVLLYGEKDSIIVPRDVMWTARYLPNLLKKIMIPGYNHLDFITAINGRERVYNHIMDISKEHENT